MPQAPQVRFTLFLAKCEDILQLNPGRLAPYFFRTLRRKNKGQVLILMYHKLCSVILLHIPCSSSAASMYIQTALTPSISKSKESIEICHHRSNIVKRFNREP